jgi:hypothetical protein
MCEKDQGKGCAWLRECVECGVKTTLESCNLLNIFHTANDRETKQGLGHMKHLLLQLANVP